MFKKIKEKISSNKIIKARNKEFNNNSTTAFDNAIIKWYAPEYAMQKRGTIWKVVYILFIVACIVFGIIFKAVTFSLAIAAFALVYYVIHKEQPKEIQIVLSDIGVKIGTMNYPYSDIKDYWIIYEPPYVKTLNFRVTNKLINELKIELNNQDPSEVRAFLNEKVKELEGQNEKFTDTLLRLFKL